MAHHMGLTWQPIPMAHLGSHTKSPLTSSYGLYSTLSMTHLMEDLLVKLAHLWAIHYMSQPSPWVSSFYGTICLTGPSHPLNWVTPYVSGHTLRVESTYKSGYPTVQVAQWVGSVCTWLLTIQIWSCDLPWELHDIERYYGHQCSIVAVRL